MNKTLLAGIILMLSGVVLFGGALVLAFSLKTGFIVMSIVAAFILVLQGTALMVEALSDPKVKDKDAS